MNNSFFTTGQFAELCETTKETLRHYNNVGILKPEKIGNNGYQYYSYRQVFEFYFIQTLKHAGCSLNKIYDYVNDETKENFKELLEEQLEKLIIEKQNIEKKGKILRQSINRLESINNYNKFNSCYIEDENEEFFIITKINNFDSNIEMFKAINNHISFCEENNIDIEYQFAYITITDYKSNTENYYIGSKISTKIECDRLHIKPNGSYIKYIHNGIYKPDEIYSCMKQFAALNGLNLGRETYEEEVSIYRGPTENYITEISMNILQL